ncbi:MAG: helix-turn-helix transcriptional regulator [Pedobacter sp.]|nr:helix-turn-helix transcriptional regulator [Pedobacter sp.]
MKTLTKRKQQDKGKTKITWTEEAIRLKAFRKFMKLSQVELAELLGVHQTMVYKYENSLGIIPIEVAKVLHDKFDMSYDWFYSNKGAMQEKLKPTSLVKDTNRLQGEIERMKAEIDGLKSQMKTIVRAVYGDKQLTTADQKGDKG